MTEASVADLEALRVAEKEQALRYRRLAALAEEVGDPATAQRLHDLHADEQHHLSRLTARLIELGITPAEVGVVAQQSAAGGADALAEWESRARQWEAEEVSRYEQLLSGGRELDPATRALAESILEVERHHAEHLSGKWTLA